MKIETHKDLEKLLKLMRAQGVKHLKMGDLELSLTEEMPMDPATQQLTASAQSSSSPQVDSPYSDEDALFWSSPSLSTQDQPKDS